MSTLNEDFKLHFVQPRLIPGVIRTGPKSVAVNNELRKKRMNKVNLTKTSPRRMKTIRKTELAIAISMLYAGQAMAACPEQLTVGQDYTATTNCTSTYAIQAKNVAAGTVTINSGVTVAGGGGGQEQGGVVLGTRSILTPTAPSSLVALVNNGTILGATTTTGIGVNMWGDGFFTEITSLTNSGTIAGQVGLLLVNDARIGTLTNNTGALISGFGDDAIRFQGGTVGTVTNDGTIQGNRGIATGFSITNGINNSGTITGTTFSLDLVNATGAFTVSNSGTLNGNVNLGINQLDLNGNSAAVNGNVTGTVNSVVNVNGTFTSGGTFSVGHFEIASGGVFNMKHDVTASSPTTFANNGTLHVDAGDTVTITGNYTQDAAAVYRTTISDDNTYGKLVVNGTATLTSNAKINVNVTDPNFVFTATSFQDIISATNLVSDGTFAVTDNSFLFDFTAVKDGHTVDLALTQTSTVQAAVEAQNNLPAYGAAAVIDATPDLQLLFGSLTTEQEVSNAASQTLPLLVGGSTLSAFNALSDINHIIQARQETKLGLSAGDGFSGDRKVWLKPFGSWAKQDDRNAASGFDGDTWGLVLGADATPSTTTRLGAAFAYANSNVNSNSVVAPQGNDVDIYQLIGYGSYSLDADTEFNFQINAGQNKNKGTRQIALISSVAESSYDSYSAHVGLGIGRNYTLSEKTRITPSVRADYTWIKDESYSETGAGLLNLNVASQTAEQLLLSLGGKLTHDLDSRTKLTANLGVSYDVINDQAQITATFAGAPSASFVTYGIDPSPWIGRAGLGLVHTLQSGMEITARYDLEARHDFTNQTASLKARWAF